MSQKKETNYKVIKDPKLAPYHIQMDQYCYTVFKATEARKTGVVREVAIGYPNSIARCFELILEDTVRDQNYNNLKDYIGEMSSTINRLKSIELI
jgi:hypothetical protein